MPASPVLILLSARGAEFPQRIDLLPLGFPELSLLLHAADPAAGVPVTHDQPAVAALIERIRATVAEQGASGLEPHTPGFTGLIDLPHITPLEPTSDRRLVAFLPRTAAVTSRGFALFGPTGHEVCALRAAELMALLDFRTPTTVEVALEAHRASLGDAALTEAEFTALVQRLIDVAVIEPVDLNDDAARPGGRHTTVREQGFSARKALLAAGNELIRKPAAPDRVSVIPMYEEPIPLNLALGMLLAHSAAYDNGRLTRTYEFLPAWMSSPKAVHRRLAREGPAVFLFSNYIWSINQNLAAANAIKLASPDSICIHGGPSTPKYDRDNERFFAENPGVDIAVRGEGEETLIEILDAIDGKLEGRGNDLSVLAEVAGLSYRVPHGLVRTPERARMANLDLLPSPYLAGLYEHVAEAGIDFQPVETNRGCPYGCTFCDWGSATNSRIRKFDLQRVLDEIEWGARNRAETLFIVDANFGIFARDVEITQKIVDCYTTYGYPRSLSNCFAKNTTKYTSQICTLLWNAGVSFQPVVALQSMDPDVLAAIDRSNIKTAAYDELADHLRDLGATVFTELMMGLPGSSLATFSHDLQGCIDREIYATVYDTMVLPNSPMNAPEYQALHQLELEDVPVRPGISRKIVASTATFTRSEREVMARRRHLFRVFEDVGLLRQVARWVRHATGTREIDFYDALGDHAAANPDALPLVTWAMHDMQFVVPPLSWRQFLDEIEGYLVHDLGIAPSSGMRTALQVQYLLIPDARRSFPAIAELPHDYAAWYAEIRAAHRARTPWWEVVPPLESFGPATFEVSGSEATNAALHGTDLLTDFAKFYELESPVMRGARTIEHKLDASPLTYSAS